MTWYLLAARVWLLLRIAWHDVRKEFRRRRRRWRLRNWHPNTIDRRPGVIIPIAHEQTIAAVMGRSRISLLAMNEQLKRAYAEDLQRQHMTRLQNAMASLDRRMSEELHDEKFIFPCHRSPRR